MDAPDVVVVGSGPNGLVAANLLADAGWRVLVLEAQSEVGGAVRSDRDVHRGFVHDTCSSFYPLAAASATIRRLGLERWGLEWTHAPAVLGHVRDDGAWTLLHHDRHRTARELDADRAGDGERWLALCERWDVAGDPLVDALTAPFPPVRAGARLLAALSRAGGARTLRDLASPADALAGRFAGPGPGLLLAGNAGHADIPLQAPGSGLLGLLLTMLGQTVGFPVPRGGAGELAAALHRRLVDRGGLVVTDQQVTEILVEHGRARGVVTADGRRHPARRAVVAAVHVLPLLGTMVPASAVPPAVRAGLRELDLDPGTVKVDWALDGPVPWAQAPSAAPGTVHVADSLAQMTEATAQVAAGAVPAEPFLLVGQMTTADPTRSPPGTESLWAYTHVPQPGRAVDDRGGDGLRGTWDHADLQRFADRIQARLERVAPGFGSRVRARRVLGPHELQALDANLLGGSLNGGSSQLHQQLLFRPVPGMRGRATTGVPGLYLASASAHPGGGVHGAPGANAARALLAHARLGRR